MQKLVSKALTVSTPPPSCRRTTPDADVVRGQELRPALSQEWPVTVPAHLHAPDLAKRAHNEGLGPVRLVAACSCVEAACELVRDALQEKK